MTDLKMTSMSRMICGKTLPGRPCAVCDVSKGMSPTHFPKSINHHLRWRKAKNHHRREGQAKMSQKSSSPSLSSWHRKSTRWNRATMITAASKSSHRTRQKDEHHHSIIGSARQSRTAAEMENVWDAKDEKQEEEELWCCMPPVRHSQGGDAAREPDSDHSFSCRCLGRSWCDDGANSQWPQKMVWVCVVET